MNNNESFIRQMLRRAIQVMYAGIYIVTVLALIWYGCADLLFK